MKQSPSWEANPFSAGQEIPYIVWNPKFHYQIYKCLLYVLILSQISPVHVPPPSHFLNPILILSFHLHLDLPSGLFPHQNPVCTCPVPYMRHMPYPSHSSQFDHPNNISWRVHIVNVAWPSFTCTWKAGRRVFEYVLIFVFLSSKWEGKIFWTEWWWVVP